MPKMKNYNSNNGKLSVAFMRDGIS